MKEIESNPQATQTALFESRDEPREPTGAPPVECLVVEQCDIVLPRGAHPAPIDNGTSLVQQLRDAPTPAHRRLLVQGMLGMLGFDWLCYWRLTRIGDSLTRALYYPEYSIPGWAERYVAEKYIDVDPRIAYACANESPLVWDLPLLLEEAAAARSHAAPTRFERLIDDAQAAGMRSGVTFGVIGARSRRHHVLTLSGTNPTKQWITERVVGAAYVLGLAVHAFLGECPEPDLPDSHARSITQVQQQILSALKTGMSDQDIARQLSMSRYNVDYHLRILRKHFGARNRVHLAYLAGQRDGA
jgi:DNA-binding CsgD family transcriptional regulator